MTIDTDVRLVRVVITFETAGRVIQKAGERPLVILRIIQWQCILRYKSYGLHVKEVVGDL